MANDHYIPRFLTARWEVGDRRLRVFDFETLRFGLVSSRRLFAEEGLNSPQFEKLLERAIETPASRYIHEVLRDDPHARFTVPANGPVRAALLAMSFIQGARTHDARTRDSILSAHLESDDTVAELARAAEAQYRPFVVQTQPDSPIFFTEATTFAVPVVGAAPALVMPISLWHGIGLLERETDESHVFSLLRGPGVATTLSIGVGSAVRRVVVPPALHGLVDETPDTAAKRFVELRGLARKLHDGIGLASLTAGLPAASWK